MATLYTHKDANIRKTWLLMTVFFMVVIALGWFFSYYYQNPSILYGFAIFSIVMNVTSYWFSDTIVVTLAGAKPIRKQEAPDLYNIVENLAITAGLPTPKIYVIQDPSPNAFATGRDPKHAVVAVTTGLMQIMDRSELEGVLAHELAHIGNRDILVMTVAVVLVGFLSMLGDMFFRMSMFGGGNNDNGNKSGAIVAIVAIVGLIIAPIAAQLMQLAISRRREFLADASGALITRYPEGLASALEKISSYQAPMQHANSATAHLYISNPFGAASAGRFVAKLFATHPPAEERIAALRSMSV
jgi:heat shock protein HtpX